MARRKAKVLLDERTETMSTTALLCRSIGLHAMSPVPPPSRVRADYAKLGQRWRKMVCLRGCTYWRIRVTDLATGEVVASWSGYDDKEAYLIKAKGTGRLPRAAAEVAYYANGGKD
jgi:hypothetical protein